MTKKATFVESIRGEMFQNIITQAKDLLTRSVDEDVNCLDSGLLEAAACMKRNIYEGPKSSKWFDVECKAARKETRKWWREFRRSKCEESKSRNRLLYVECRKSFRILLKQKRQSHRENKLKTLTAKVNDSKTFWSEVRSVSGGTCRQPVISTTECFTHFESVLGNETNLGRGEDDYVDPPWH